MSSLVLKNISLSFGLEQLLDKINLVIGERERLCIMGRNGAGKSTLLKIIAGTQKPDEGEIQQQGHIIVATLPQDMPKDTQKTVYQMVSDSLNIDNQHETYKVDAILSRLGLEADTAFDALSGGYKRRVLLAKSLVNEPDILLMDEPTNHLDLAGIEWLENFIKSFSGSIVFIAHDRAFLQNTANRIIEVDRGHLIEFPGNYQNYLNKKAHFLEVEETQNKKFDKMLADEEVWIRQGIKARRTRNEGRVRALEALRKERQARRDVVGKVDLAAQNTSASGKIVVDMKHINHQYLDTPLIRDFSTTIMRGDKIGIIGNNGCGKSTLIQILLQMLKPNSGTVTHGTKLEIAYFDQHREQLDLNKTVADNVSHGDQHVTFNGRSIHIISYLKQFLFTPERAKALVKTLSGGEKNRLLLARLFSKAANFLVLDEPTNDLDLETLEILEDLLVNYDGTLLLVSHDRVFLNNVVTSTLVFEGDGKINEYVGGYDDWLRQKSKASSLPKKKPNTKQQLKPDYNAQKEIRTLENKIDTLEVKIKKLKAVLAEPELYQPENQKQLQKKQAEQKQLENDLNTLLQQWEAFHNE